MVGHRGASYVAIAFLCFTSALRAGQVVVYCSIKEDVGRTAAERFEKETGTTAKLVRVNSQVAQSKELSRGFLKEWVGKQK